MKARETLLARVSTADGATEIKDPSTGEVIGRYMYGTAADVKAAVDKAAAAQPAWAALTDEERVGYLLRAADNIEARAEETRPTPSSASRPRPSLASAPATRSRAASAGSASPRRLAPQGGPRR